MKTRIFLLCFFLSQAVLTWATHNRAGFITLRYVSDLNYQATVTTFTKVSIVQADRDTLNLDWGDGTIEKVLRSNGNGSGVELPGGYDLKLNTYISSVHTYAFACDYLVSTTDANRNADIININGGASGNIPFYIETYLKAGVGICENSAAILLSPPIILANINDTFTFNPNIMDPNGDSLHFELVPPLFGHDAPVPNYQYPDEIESGTNNLFSINHYSGEILWAAPQRIGAYNVAVRASEFKNELFYGYTIFDFMIVVKDDNVDPPRFSTTWQTDSNGNYSFIVNTGDSVQFTFSATADSLSAIGEPFLTSQPASFSQSGIAPSLNGSFLWIPDSSHSRLHPYITTFRASNQDIPPFERDLTVLIYVTGGSRSSCTESPSCNTTIETGAEFSSTVVAFPNPCSSSCRIAIRERSSGENLTLILYDVIGSQVYSLPSSNGEFILQKANLEAGLYLFRVYGYTSKSIAAGKVVFKND